MSSCPAWRIHNSPAASRWAEPVLRAHERAGECLSALSGYEAVVTHVSYLSISAIQLGVSAGCCLWTKRTIDCKTWSIHSVRLSNFVLHGVLCISVLFICGFYVVLVSFLSPCGCEQGLEPVSKMNNLCIKSNRWMNIKAVNMLLVSFDVCCQLPCWKDQYILYYIILYVYSLNVSCCTKGTIIIIIYNKYV